MQIDADFRPLLHGFDLDALEAETSTIVGVWADHRLAYTNAGWEHFARDNQAPMLVEQWPLGRSILEAIPNVLLDFYLDGAQRATTGDDGWTHTYECSSPEQFRLFRLRVVPLTHPDTDVVSGLLYVHSLLIEEHWPAPAAAAPSGEYLQDGVLTSCAHCRRFRRPSDQGDEWVFVPDWLVNPPGLVSHGVCEPCAGYYYYQRYRMARSN